MTREGRSRLRGQLDEMIALALGAIDEDSPDVAYGAARYAAHLSRLLLAARQSASRNAWRRERYSAMRSLGMVQTPYGWE